MVDYINVNLYGNGTRGCHLRAEYITCPHYESCSLYKEGKCCCVTDLFSKYCPLGKISCADYGTKQSQKYYKGYNEVKADEKYHKLSRPSSCYLYTTKDFVCLSIPYITISVDNETNTLKIKDTTSLFGNPIVAVPLYELTNNNLYKICSAVPRTIFDNVPIKDYQNKVVPEFLIQLKTLLPDIYEKFVSEYSQYKTEFEDINYCGKRAYLATCNTDPELIYRDVHKNAFHFVKDSPTKMVCESYTTGFSPFGAKAYTVIIDVNDTMICEITDNKQVLRTTKFV